MYIITLGAIDGKSNTEKQTVKVRKACGPGGYCRKAAHGCDSEAVGQQWVWGLLHC